MSRQNTGAQIPFVVRVTAHTEALLREDLVDEALAYCKAEVDKLVNGQVGMLELIRTYQTSIVKASKTTPPAPPTGGGGGARIQCVMIPTKSPIAIDYQHILHHDVRPSLARLFSLYMGVRHEHDPRFAWLA